MEHQRVVLVGTYKGDQLAKWRGWYNYPISDGDFNAESQRGRDGRAGSESTVQIELFSWDNLQPVHLPKQGEFTAVELFAGAGGLSIGLERAGIHAVIANEIMPDLAATLAANHPEANMANEDTCRFKEVA